VYDLYLQIETLATAKVNMAADRVTGDRPRGVGMLHLKRGRALVSLLNLKFAPSSIPQAGEL
jgi:hypothetical protein